ncbi:MAG: patatin-like phospholipase family protein [Solirubrobacteraceae bacterium]
MFRPDEISGAEDRHGRDDGESRDRGIVKHVPASDRWNASMCAQSPNTRWKAFKRLVHFGERPEPIPSHRGPVQVPGSTGICCSGGGIRSAAFNLGALQALQRARRLQQADYLAGVSGGSYIAAAFCMVGKTSADPNDDDSDPDLLAQCPPFAPGSPEEQYLRNRSSYMAPDADAKAYLGMRLVLGMAFNLVFLALPIAALSIVAGVLIYMPFFGELRNGLHPTTLAIVIPSAVAGGCILIGLVGMLRRAPKDRCGRFSQTWAVRLLGVATLIAIVTLVLPALVDAVQTSGDASTDTAREGVGQTTGGAGVAGLIAGLLASLRQLFSTPKNLVAGVRGTRGWAAKLNSRMRKLLMQAAALVAGPMLLLTIVVAALTVTAQHDNADLWLLLAAGGALGVFGALYHWADLTTWSLHPFYKRRLSTAFALKRVLPQNEPSIGRRAVIEQECTEGVAVERNFNNPVPLSETACPNGPTLVICAAANISDPGATPAGRRVTSFTFSAESIGGPLIGGIETRRFEQAFDHAFEAASLTRRRKRDFTLPAAVAMSGAALAPSMGKTSNRSLRFLMTLANIRLGVWVPNPRWVAGTEQPHDSQLRRHKRPRPWYLLAELLGYNRVDAKYLYVTDGGHYENLGLVELLRRGCTNVYCFDASGGQTFAELGDAVALARSELGVEIEIDPTRLEPAGDPATAKVAVTDGTITYPTGETGRLVYARNVVAPGTPWDVQAHQRKDAAFPHDSTADQLYTDQKFEAYRVLGERAGMKALKVMDRVGPSASPSAPTPPVPEPGHDHRGPTGPPPQPVSLAV